MTYRLAWTGVLGALLALIGGVGVIGAVLGHRGVLMDLYGSLGLVVGLLLDAAFLAGGLVLLWWGWRTRRAGRSFLRQFADWLDEHSRAVAANSAWSHYPSRKARVAAISLSVLFGILSWGTLALFTSNPAKALILAIPLWAAFSVFGWALTVDVARAYKWGVVLLPPLVVIWVVLAFAIGI